MTRRHFIRNFLITFKSLAMLSMIPRIPCAVASVDSVTETSHYKLLNGRSLRNIAKNKMNKTRGYTPRKRIRSNYTFLFYLSSYPVHLQYFTFLKLSSTDLRFSGTYTVIFQLLF